MALTLLLFVTFPRVAQLSADDIVVHSSFLISRHMVSLLSFIFKSNFMSMKRIYICWRWDDSQIVEEFFLGFELALKRAMCVRKLKLLTVIIALEQLVREILTGENRETASIWYEILWSATITETYGKLVRWSANQFLCFQLYLTTDSYWKTMRNRKR